jgi:uncharacterized membrane protein YczE
MKFRPHKSIPKTPWTAKNFWDLSISRIAILFCGLTLFGLGEGLLVNSYLGNAPWTVFSQGLSKQTGLDLGWCSLIISAVILLIWLLLGQKPGFGTISNMLWLALILQLTVDYLPKQNHHQVLGLIYVALGILSIGFGSSIYITCGLGPGPRDGLMTALHYKTGIRTARVRIALEVTALTIGYLMGGRLGIGTVLFALTIGYSVAFFMGLVNHYFAISN